MFSSVENGVSLPGSALTVRSHSPPYRGGVGGGAGGAGPCCHLPPCCHHRYISETQWLRKAGGRVAANFVKKIFFRAVRLTADKNSVKTSMVVLLRLTKLTKLFQNSQK